MKAKPKVPPLGPDLSEQIGKLLCTDNWRVLRFAPR